MKKYNHKAIEKKWQKHWEENRIFSAKDFSDKPKYYCLIEFPYPSGDGLHVGHPRSYTALDIIARKKRMEGYNVLYPIGFDAFGLPTENYAIKKKIHPKIITERNIATFTRQLKELGFSFDWERMVITADPSYYKWTQWIFLKLFEKGLAYKDNIPINWCLSCKIGLANEEVVNGRCERCGGPVEKRNKEQWMLKITAYAQRLIDDLNGVEYLDKIMKQQINWIGRSDGADIKFSIQGGKEALKVFTTRPDTLFGATYMVLAPEHALVEKITTKEHKEAVSQYVEAAKKKSDLERSEISREKTGVFTGAYALNPANGKPIPIWVADYVLISYGTGAIMAVPGHDQRDWDFARTFNLPVVEVIQGGDISREAYEGEGILINSGFLNGKNVEEAIAAMSNWLKEKELGGPAVKYKLRDWVFSRQRYWGEPIPIVICRSCGFVPVPEKDLPVLLPDVERYEPSDAGESPLAAIKDWVKTPCPKCGGPAERETDTMPNWAGSSWYFLRYTDPHNDKAFADSDKLKYWMPIDLYNGGMEHTTLHLLYSRFWNKFLYDCGFVPFSEPYARRTAHGMILGEGGEKMSKSRGNVVNPDDVIERYGADVFRCYEMFIGPFDQTANWDTKGIEGIHRFLLRVWRLIVDERSGGLNDKMAEGVPEKGLLRNLHQTIKIVGEHINQMRFNTAISQMMILVNELYKKDRIPVEIVKVFVLLLSPFAPHIAEELWEKLGEKESVLRQPWPLCHMEYLAAETMTIVVQINGKVRANIDCSVDISREDLIKMVLEQERVKKYTEGKKIHKIVIVPKKLVSIVVS
ncbi:MAG: leucine--tRNA ligase [Candidatus Aminicenantes bacterium]|nr:leucine--tRNA ligase [Candidatus Aminicenantes bacterium]